METVQHLLKKRAEETPDQEALVGGGYRFSFKEYHQRVNQLAHHLCALNVQKGDRVVILCQNNHPYPTILMACLKIGAIALPINRQLSSYELENIVSICQPQVLFYDQMFESTLTNIFKAETIPHMILTGIDMDTASCFDEIFKTNPVTDPDVTVSADDSALFLFTSGTTGVPKACDITQGTLATYIGMVKGDLTFDGQRFLAVHPLYHMSSTMYMISAVNNGNTLIFLSEMDSGKICDLIEEEQVTTMFAFPYVYTYMLDEIKKQTRDLSSLKTVTSGGTNVPAKLVRQYADLGIPMFHGYGSTEAFAVSFYHPDMDLEKAESAGKPLPHIDVKIIDPDTGKALPKNEIGEVVVKSPFAFNGYWNNQEATNKVMKDGWFYMGDAGKIDQDGFLHVMGRYKDVIVYGGDNIYADEVEEVIQALPDVLESAVVGMPDAIFGEVPQAYIVKKTESELTEATVRKQCQDRLARYKVPNVAFIDDLPKNALGKVLKRQLREEAGTHV